MRSDNMNWFDIVKVELHPEFARHTDIYEEAASLLNAQIGSGRLSMADVKKLQNHYLPLVTKALQDYLDTLKKLLHKERGGFSGAIATRVTGTGPAHKYKPPKEKTVSEQPTLFSGWQ